ncbi:cationic amino acid transporter 2 isoform X2 [Halyomorpha halys]|nr:probable cationic amino acid transporter isoform X3 [Halyomorpha halys]XP_024217816.1 probable cationic amino acid transporter isoform X3 [Halyomorpha halys]
MTTILGTLSYHESDFSIGLRGIEFTMVCFCTLHGFGIYKLIPTMIINNVGIMLLFSWIVYGIVTLITASCFAELTALGPCTGSTYHYSYNTISEFLAFLVGWNKILSYSTIILSYCSFTSSIIDEFFFGGWLRTNYSIGKEHCFGVVCVKGYVDLIVPVIILSLAYIASWSIHTFKIFIMVVTSISLIIIFTIISGLIMDFRVQRPRILINECPRMVFEDIGETVVYGLMGYNSIAILGDEAKHSSKTIPKSIISVIVMVVITDVLFTLLLLYVMSENTILEKSTYPCPLSTFLESEGYKVLSWLSNIGALFGFWGGAITMIFTLSRILFSMSKDGLLFDWCGRISMISQSSVLTIMLFAAVLSLIGAFIEIDYHAIAFDLILEKVIILVSLLVTRYRCEQKKEKNSETHKCWVLFNYPNGQTVPTLATERVSRLLIFLIVLTAYSSVYCILMMFVKDAELFVRALALCTVLFLLLFTFCLHCQPQNNRMGLSYTVPGVPILPVFSLIFEFFIATYLSKTNWWLAYFWTIIGIIFYFTYSITHSKKNDLTDSLGNIWNPFRKKSKNTAPDIRFKSTTTSIVDPAKNQTNEEELKSFGVSFNDQSENLDVESSNEYSK